MSKLLETRLPTELQPSVSKETFNRLTRILELGVDKLLYGLNQMTMLLIMVIFRSVGVWVIQEWMLKPMVEDEQIIRNKTAYGVTTFCK